MKVRTMTTRAAAEKHCKQREPKTNGEGGDPLRSDRKGAYALCKEILVSQFYQKPK